MDESTLLDQLHHGAIHERRAAAMRLGMMHNPVIIPDLLRAAQTDDDSLRSLLASALAALGDAALEPLRKALSHEHVTVRIVAVMALRHINPPTLADDLAPLADDPDETVRRIVG